MPGSLNSHKKRTGFGICGYWLFHTSGLYLYLMDRYDTASGLLIGKGSYGSVFLVSDRSCPGVRVVLKRIPLAELSPKEVASAQQEVALMRQLRHPFLVPLLDSFVDRQPTHQHPAAAASPRQCLCLIMPYCLGWARAWGESFI